MVASIWIIYYVKSYDSFYLTAIQLFTFQVISHISIVKKLQGHSKYNKVAAFISHIYLYHRASRKTSKRPGDLMSGQILGPCHVTRETAIRSLSMILRIIDVRTGGEES